MSSAINTPGKRKRARDGIEYDYLPRTPGTMFTMDLGSQPRSGATYFEPPVIPIQPPVRCHFDRNEDFAIGGITSWPQDSLQDPCSRHDSYFGNASFFENQFEAPRLNYTFRPLERDDNLPHAEAHPRSQLGQIEYNTNSLTRGASPPTGLDQSDLPIANTISDWVTKSRNLTMLPPEITIDSPSSVAPPSTQFLDPPSVLEVEPRPSTDLAMTMARRRQHLYHWGSQTSSSSENYFQTPPSSLSTSEGKHDVGWYSGSTNLPERHQRHSISTDTSELSGHGSGSLQPVVYTPQSSSRGDWPGTSHNLPRISALTKGLQEVGHPKQSEDLQDAVLPASVPASDSFVPRMAPLILPAPPKQKDLTAPWSIQLDLSTSQKTSNRRILTPKGREEAKAVRDVGACLICRHLNKTKCSSVPGKPCESCQSLLRSRQHLLESEELATGICIRVNLQTYRKGIDDLYDVATRKYNIPLKPDAWKRTILIGHCIRTKGTNCAYFPTDVNLSLDVQDCEFIGHGFGRKTRWEESSGRMSSYRIEDDTLPSATGLDKWGRNLMKEFSEQIPDFEPSIRDKFLFDYCDVRPLLPFHKLVDLTIRMISLSLWLYGTHPVVSPADLTMNNSPLFEMSDPSIDPMLSPIARGQLRSIAARAMEETENEILKFFDEAIKKPPEDVVIVGLCLWRLALLYRTMMKRYKLILYDACIDRRRERQKVMYEAMTTGYSLVYRRSAPPCSPAWRMEDHLHFFGDNADLVDTFLQLQVADKKFYEENINDDDDFHARKLLWERMVKGGRGMKGR